MTDEGLTTEINTIRSHRDGDGTLDAVSATVELSGTVETRVRVHYAVEEGVATLDRFVVDDDISVFEVADLACVPVAERAITVIPGVEEVEPALETFGRALELGKKL
ncbi:hypothetical protein [Halogeometricum limi]|uniref:Uncharacterized protein n=1 Tax=Halogeometricum limi TaxID=555875 RepID=A0A1I6ITC2_9EURY|nr:hypothetical protein [Halogeometricum limi]SFR69968.1 hypothetical protein SAMN04488124_3633 [Halogeometricum limi]